MQRFIFEKRDGLYIIDLAKTMQQIREAIAIVKSTVASRKSILFVGTKKQAKGVIQECAEMCGEFYVSERWLGGTLTNLTTIRQSVKKLERIEKQIAGGGEMLVKKELSMLGKNLAKLERNLSGIRNMRRPPGLVIVVDPSHEHIAVAEANKLNVPVMALVDTNCDPDPIQHVIACNDDSLKSIKLIIQALSDAAGEQKAAMRQAGMKDDEEEGEEGAMATVEEDAEGAKQ